MGIALVDGNGTDQVFKRGCVFQGLGYRVAVLRDDDVQPTPALEQEFASQSGRVTAWRTGRTLEDELFLSLSDDAVLQLVEFAVELHGEDLIDANIKSASNGAFSLAVCRSSLTQNVRIVFGKASRTKKAGWFKSVTWMEQVAREIVAPDLSECDQDFSKAVFDLFEWMENGA
jgi:hypothetical protein